MSTPVARVLEARTACAGHGSVDGAANFVCGKSGRGVGKFDDQLASRKWCPFLNAVAGVGSPSLYS